MMKKVFFILLFVVLFVPFLCYPSTRQDSINSALDFYQTKKEEKKPEREKSYSDYKREMIYKKHRDWIDKYKKENPTHEIIIKEEQEKKKDNYDKIRNKIAKKYKPKKSGLKDNKDISYNFGENLFFSLGFPLKHLHGEDTYRINFDAVGYGGKSSSELVWPLNNTFYGISLSLNYLDAKYNMDKNNPRSKARVNFSWYIDGDSHTGKKMQDSDWIGNDTEYINYTYNLYDLADDGLDNDSIVPGAAIAVNNGKDLYSESDCFLDNGEIWEFEYVYNTIVEKKWSLGFLLGYKYQHFKYSAFGLEARGYGPYNSVSGLELVSYNISDSNYLKWGTYDTRSIMFYFGFSTEFVLNERFSLFCDLGFSPWVKLDNEDVHLYPTSSLNEDMVSTAEYEGHAYLLKLKGSFNMSDSWILDFGGEYSDIDTKGDSVQKHYYDGVYSGSSSPISSKAEIVYYSFFGALKYLF